MKVDVPTSQRSKYYTGMTTEMLEQQELPPAKGIWIQNMDALLKVATQMEQKGEFNTSEEFEQTELEQHNVRVGGNGRLLDDCANLEVQRPLSKLNLNDDDEIETTTSVSVESIPVANPTQLKWADEDVTSTVPPHFQETESFTTLDPLDYRKRNHFNGRPFVSWGNLFPPLYGSVLMPLAPMTEKLWWQMARNQVPSDTNTTGYHDQTFVNKVKKFMEPKFSAQKWDEQIMSDIARTRESTQNPDQQAMVRRGLQAAYKIKFPRSSAMYDTKFFAFKKGEFVPRSCFNEENHQIYANRSKIVKTTT